MRSRPRREWWSLTCALKCGVSSLMRAVSSATWTSGEPVSLRARACAVTISVLLMLANAISGLLGAHLARDLWINLSKTAADWRCSWTGRTVIDERRGLYRHCGSRDSAFDRRSARIAARVSSRLHPASTTSGRHPMRHAHAIVLTTLLLATSATARAAEPGSTALPGADDTRARAIVAAVDPAALRATIERLVLVRHPSHDVRHGVRDARHRRRPPLGGLRVFAAISKDCGGCLEIVTPSQTFTGPALAAAHRGDGCPRDPARHERSDAGRDDRGPHRLAQQRRHGLHARRAGRERRRVGRRGRHRVGPRPVEAPLSAPRSSTRRSRARSRDSTAARCWPTTRRRRAGRSRPTSTNDIVGNTFGEDGVHDSSTIRVFSEGTKAVETQAQANVRRYRGGEIDSPSRNIARYMATIAERDMAGFRVRMVYRTDRFGRGRRPGYRLLEGRFSPRCA